MGKMIIEEIIEKIKAALPPDKDGKVTLDADIIYELLDELQDIPFSMRLLDATMNRCKELNQIRDEVLSSENKRQAYQTAANKLNWNIDKRKIKRDQIFREYLHLTGVVMMAGHVMRDHSKQIEDIILKDGPLPKLMGRKEAIDFLTEKNQIKSWSATFQKLDEARRSLISELKAKNYDYSFLEDKSILPPNWNAGNQKEDETIEPQRNTDCTKYKECLNNAAFSNTSLDCSKCKKYEQII